MKCKVCGVDGKDSEDKGRGRVFIMGDIDPWCADHPYNREALCSECANKAISIIGVLHD